MTSSEFLAAIIDSGFELEEREEAELRSLLTNNDDARTQESGTASRDTRSDEQIVINEFFRSIGGQDSELARESAHDANEHDMSRPLCPPSWAFTKARYDEMSHKRDAWRAQVADFRKSSETTNSRYYAALDWAVQWQAREHHLRPQALRGGSWAPGKGKFSQSLR